MIDSATALLLTEYEDIVSKILLLPLSIGEISAIFWLMIKGVKSV
jgi:hypothetical protein